MRKSPLRRALILNGEKEEIEFIIGLSEIVNFVRYEELNMPKQIKVFSFFSGSGFLDLGFERAGFVIDFVNEFSPSFTNAYKFARAKMGIAEPRFGYSNDVNEFIVDRAKELRAHIEKEHKEGCLVGFIGGPPCPDFSVAGKQKGRDGDNGKLSKSYVDLICAQKPDFFLFENVKGLWRTAKHRAYYDDLKRALSQYYDLTDRLCNALEFGVPQDRDRIILFGVRKTVAQQLHLNIDVFDWNAHIKYNLKEVKNLPWPPAEPFSIQNSKPAPKGIPQSLTVQYWFEQNDVLHHPNAMDFFTPRAGLARMMVIQEGDDSKKSYKRLHRWRYSPTVAYGNNEVHLHPYQARRLSAAEAMALQSMPAEFSLPPEMSLSDKFKTIGNGVPFLLANGIALTIQDFLNLAR